MAITGPTAVGKTSLTRNLASQRDISVISVDSRQIYKEIDIGSAKPNHKEMSEIPHYLVDEIQLDQKLSAGLYRNKVLEATKEILGQERIPVWIGGSTLYFHSLLFGIAEIPQIDPAVRKRISIEYSNDAVKALDRLGQVDPVLAKGLDSSKSHRIIRGLEVYDATNKTLSSFHEDMSAPEYPFKIELVVLEREREELYTRINSRVDQMISDGLVDEVRSILLKHQNAVDLPGLNSIGYTEVLKYLKDEIDEEEMLRLVKRNTRRYAKRQITWFKKYSNISTTLNLSDLSQKEVLGNLLGLLD